jgi:hypothetical protein
MAKTLKFVKYLCKPKVKANNKLYFLKGKKIMNDNVINLVSASLLFGTGLAGGLSINGNLFPDIKVSIPVENVSVGRIAGTQPPTPDCHIELEVKIFSGADGRQIEESQLYPYENQTAASNAGEVFKDSAKADGNSAQIRYQQKCNLPRTPFTSGEFTK